MATAITSMTQSTPYDAVGAMHHQKPQYTFDQPENYHMKTAAAAANANTRKHRRQHQRTQSDDHTDSGSLTYSAASSINSAGESTDSSFADIMKVLEMHDPNELGPLMKEKGLSPAEYQLIQHQHASLAGQPSFGFRGRSSQVSVTSSLQYSTDGESNILHGADLVSTITGQPSDSMAHDGGSYNNEADTFDNITFAPADPTDSLKKRKKEKKQSRVASRGAGQDGSTKVGLAEPNRLTASSPKGALDSMQSMSSAHTFKQSGNTGKQRKNYTSNSTPPPIPKANTTVEEDICYAEWWMSCFPDAFKEMMPRR